MGISSKQQSPESLTWRTARNTLRARREALPLWMGAKDDGTPFFRDLVRERFVDWKEPSLPSIFLAVYGLAYARPQVRVHVIDVFEHLELVNKYRHVHSYSSPKTLQTLLLALPKLPSSQRHILFIHDYDALLVAVPGADALINKQSYSPWPVVMTYGNHYPQMDGMRTKRNPLTPRGYEITEDDLERWFIRAHLRAVT